MRDPAATKLNGLSSPLVELKTAAMASGVVVSFVTDERPQTIWRPPERNLRSYDGKLRRVGFASVVVTVRRWIGKGYPVHHRSHPHNQTPTRTDTLGGIERDTHWRGWRSRLGKL